jgi:hypothetical protein
MTTTIFVRPSVAALAGMLLASSASIGFDGPPPTLPDGRLTAEARLAAQQRIHPAQAASRPPAADRASLAVEIPPVALVHRYYYSGDRSFQGPMLPGGPSILVMNHPRTNERIYLDVMMLPGAPRVTYRRHSIEYDYGAQAMTITFGPHGRPSVTYRNGVPLIVTARRATAHLGRSTSDMVQRTGIPSAGRQVAAGVKNVAETTADRVHDAGKAVVAPIVGAIKSTPLANVLTSSAEDRAAHIRDAAVQQAAAAAKDLDATLPTVR